MRGQRNKGYNTILFLRWMGRALWHSMVLFFIPMFVFRDGTGNGGRTFGMWDEGTVVYTSLLIIVNLVAALETSFWIWLTHFSIWGSIIAWIIFGSVYSLFPVLTAGVMYNLATSAIFWVLLLWLPCGALMMDYTWKFCKRYFLPSKVHIIQELQVRSQRAKEGKDRARGWKFPFFEGEWWGTVCSAMDSFLGRGGGNFRA